MGSCELVNWSRWYHISRADRPLSRIRVFRFAVAIASVTGETVPPSGETRNSSSPSSAMHFSATGFLFTFFTWPISTVILCRRNSSSLDREENPGAGSTLITAHGPDIGRSSRQRKMRLARRVSWRSFSIMHDVVNEVAVSRTTRMSCLFLFITSAANERPTASGGSDVDCSIKQLGIFLSEAQMWHDCEHRSRALSRSNA